MAKHKAQRETKGGIKRMGLKPVHCKKCKTNYWRHESHKDPERCGVCEHDGLMQHGHVKEPTNRQLKRDRH